MAYEPTKGMIILLLILLLSFSPFLVCCSSLGAFCAVDRRAVELLPVFSFPDSLLETEPSSLGNLLRVAMATEAMVSLLHAV